MSIEQPLTKAQRKAIKKADADARLARKRARLADKRRDRPTFDDRPSRSPRTVSGGLPGQGRK